MSSTGRALVEARGLRKSFRAAAGLRREAPPPVVAVDGVDLTVNEGETLGLVGESGSGKTTVGRLVIRLVEADAGSVRFDGTDLMALSPGPLRRMRRQFQIIFQDPYSALNPRMRIGSLVAEPLAIHGIGASRAERWSEAARLLAEVGLDRSALERYPHELSGGQRQRIGIARAIACRPRFVVADEPVSALDPPVQAQIVNLLVDLQEKLSLAYLLIAHHLALVAHVSDRVAVMYLGRIVEEARTSDLFREPLHPYTRALLASTPKPRPGPPAPLALPEDPLSARPASGCRFRPRCPVAIDACSEVDPVLRPAGDSRSVACHLVHPT